MNEKRSAPPARHNRESKAFPTSVYHDVFDTVKDNVSMTEAVRRYGYEPNRAGFICCPLHGEKTPSLKIYKNGFYCFGCGEGGSVIDFTAKLFGIDPLGAVRRLDQDFLLGLPLDRPPTAEEREAAQNRQHIAEARRMFGEWREKMLTTFTLSLRAANLADWDNLTDAEVMAIRWREPLEHWYDVLSCGSIEVQMELFRDREGVERRCRMILSSTPTKSRVA